MSNSTDKLNTFIAANRQTLQTRQLTAAQAKLRLAEDDTRKPFEPFRLPTVPNFYRPGSFDELYEMLMRPQPVRGGEVDLERNARQLQAELITQLKLTATLSSPASQLQGLAEAFREQERIARRDLAQDTAQFEEKNQRLEEFQLKMQHQFPGVWNWAIDAWEWATGKEKVSPWAAADYFNQRELAAWQMQVDETLIRLFGVAAEQAEAQAQKWEALGKDLPQQIEQIQRELAQWQQRMDAPRPGASLSVRGSFIVDGRLALASSAIDPGLMADGPERVLERLHAKAGETVRTLVEPLTAVEALEAEGQAAGLADPLLVPGNHLREVAVPISAVTDSAQPRRVNFAVFPTTTPPVDAENLSVICDGPSDAIVYMTLLLRVEPEDLTAYHEALLRAHASAQKVNLTTLPEIEPPELEPVSSNGRKRRNGHEPAAAQSNRKEVEK